MASDLLATFHTGRPLIEVHAFDHRCRAEPAAQCVDGALQTQFLAICRSLLLCLRALQILEQTRLLEGLGLPSIRTRPATTVRRLTYSRESAMRSKTSTTACRMAVADDVNRPRSHEP